MTQEENLTKKLDIGLMTRYLEEEPFSKAIMILEGKLPYHFGVKYNFDVKYFPRSEVSS